MKIADLFDEDGGIKTYWPFHLGGKKKDGFYLLHIADDYQVPALCGAVGGDGFGPRDHQRFDLLSHYNSPIILGSRLCKRCENRMNELEKEVPA